MLHCPGHLLLLLLHCCMLLLPSLLQLAAAAAAPDDSGKIRFNITMPKDAKTANEEDAYYCTVLPLPPAPMKLVGVEPLARQEVVHHILLFGARALWLLALAWPGLLVSCCARHSRTMLKGVWG